MGRDHGIPGRGRRSGSDRAASRALAAWLAASGLLAATPAGAGATGETWPVPRARSAPAIDGVADPVWADAPVVDIGIDIYNIDLQALHDDRTFYLLVRNHTDSAVDDGDRFSLTFDDEGGSGARLWSGSWSRTTCDAEGDEGEGRLEIEGFGQEIAFVGHLLDGSICAGQVNDNGIRATIAQDHPVGGGVTFEIAIPIDGPAALEATAGDQFGAYLGVVDEIGGIPYAIGSWPAVSTLHDLANASLTTLGCNAAGEDFDPGLGADWTRSHGAVAVDWILTGGGGCTVPNYTGGAGRAICLEYAGTDAVEAVLDSQAVSVVGATSAELRLRANFQHSPGLRLGVLGSTDGGLSWSEALLNEDSSDLGGATGPGVVLSLPLPASMLGQPDARFRVYFRAEPGSAPGFAQVDDLRLTCGPVLFRDGFESGLTTHWSATTPYP